MHERLAFILNQLINGDLSCLNTDNIIYVSNAAVQLLDKELIDDYDKACMDAIISISQIVYNNTDREMLFLEDGVYDLLLEKDKKYNDLYQVGAPEISFYQNGEESREEFSQPMVFVEDAENFKKNSFYFDDLTRRPPLSPAFFRTVDRNSNVVISKKNINIPHMYPKLVGTLDKCKFVLDKDAVEKGVYNDSNVKIFERDFLGLHLSQGIFGPNDQLELIAELKYDGVSVEADVTHEIKSARSRGDANADIAADLSPIFKGYRFPFAPEIPDNESFGMKFEAIMTYQDLDKMAALRGKAYKNSRNGIIGLLGASDAYNFRDLITLVPLATSIEGIDRVDEIEFMNKYYNSGEYLRYSILRGNYIELLYQVDKFVKEAEAMRPMMSFMYDGVVISYRDPSVRARLGRENSVNKFSMAIKFNPLVRQAIFTGYTYTVGQDGTITPMIHYTPVEFLGGIHTKSSGHSFKRFTELGLAKGDILRIEYTNDVMPYVTKQAVQANYVNPNPPEVFPEICPSCGSHLILADSKKSIVCPNISCPERTLARICNMCAKLNLKDFGEETIRALKTKSFSEFMSYTKRDFRNAGFGDIMSAKLASRIYELNCTPVYDYVLVGSIGFTGIAIETWKKILSKIPFKDIMFMDKQELYNKLVAISGIGQKTAYTIVYERDFFNLDLGTINAMSNVIHSYGEVFTGTVIRYTGCRPDEDLISRLSQFNCDANPNGSVTKNTDVLVVPYIGFQSSKTSKLREDAQIVEYSEFSKNPQKYIKV